MEAVRISESIPEAFKGMLLYDEVEGWVIGFYDDKRNGFFQSADGLKLENITHHLPLPKVPSWIERYEEQKE